MIDTRRKARNFEAVDLAWLPALASALGVILVTYGLLWALSAQPSGAGGGSAPGVTGGNLSEGRGGGTGAAGDALGAGSAGAESGATGVASDTESSVDGAAVTNGEADGAEADTEQVVEAEPTIPAKPIPDGAARETTPADATPLERAAALAETQVAVEDDESILGFTDEAPEPSPKDRKRKGAAGAYGRRKRSVAANAFAARGEEGRERGRQLGATAASEEAVALGLQWLAKVQEADGSWNTGTGEVPGVDRGRGARREPRQAGQSAYGITGLALLAFLGDGHTHKKKGPYQETIRRALAWIVQGMAANGSVQPSHTFYEQGICGMALCEAYGMTKDRKLRGPAGRITKFILSQMGADGGYGYGGAGRDTSVTGFQIMAIKSAMVAGFRVRRSKVTKLKRYLAKSVLPDGQTGYNYQQGPRPSMTAVGLFCRLFLSYGRKDVNVIKAAKILDAQGPTIQDEYYTYYGTFCMFQMGGGYWKRWNARFRDAVVALQVRDSGFFHGSFPRRRAGRVYGTAMYLLALEVYQRFLPMYDDSN